MEDRHLYDKAVFHTLLRRHKELRREVTYLPDGIRAVTTSDQPDLVRLIQEHAQAMHQRMSEGFGLRFWDPAFLEIFAQADAIVFKIGMLPNGVVANSTSEDPNVVKLIYTHAQAVSSFVDEGFIAARRATSLPEGYFRKLSGED
ncbi:hypothetical protein BJI67_15535 [Acidihalobacter aeolianus]|uniref:Uncharacterized protein n=2 Tax=Acidihalobacter aeolianus TaxID=2792603 RepID=A0A1D8KCK1_9GAMM|nr:hypothetical protein BJI67_15535 [Acidihalobacter aeolianus]